MAIVFNAPSSQPPTYTFETKNGTFQIIVNYDFKDDLTNVKELMKSEAEKSSLMGMAFINKLAQEKNPMAQQIASLYDGYRHFFINRNIELLLKACQQILEDPNADVLTIQMASYIKNCFEHEKTIQSDGKIFIKNLIPFIKQSLILKPPKIIFSEQIVKIDEMQAPHNAFPDLIKYNDDYYVCFREGKSHVGYQDYGRIRILRGQFLPESKQWKWENIALLANELYDFRDPKFFIDSQNQLRLILDGSIINEEDETAKMIPHVAFQVGEKWKIEEAKVDPSANGDKGQWIWRITWNHLTQAGYGFSYGKDKGLSLMKTTNGVNYEKIANISTPKIQGESLTEGTIRFKDDGTAFALIRTDKRGLIGIANKDSDYTNWSFHVIPFRLGGPNFVFSKNEDPMWAGTRHLFLNPDNTLDEATIIAFMDEKRLVPLLRLQSNLDNSYPGMVLEEDGSITVIFYSSEIGEKSNIYITRIMPP